MLFDLRGRGRRRTVQGIYVTLAVILGGGFVFLGVGGTGSGGLLDAFKSDNNTAGATDQVDKDISRVERTVRLNPKNEAAWARLARLRYQSASVAGFDDQTQLYTKDGLARLREAGQAWDRYLALDPDKPDARVAAVMVQAFTNTQEFDKAVTAQDIITESRTDVSNTQRSNLFSQLAALAYAAGQTDKADLAGKRAVELAPKADKNLVRQRLQQAKTAAQAQSGQTSTTPQATTTPGATAPSPSTTSTTPKTLPAPATTTP